MRVAVFNDYPFRRADGRVWTERAFIVFLGGLAEQVEHLVVPGRLHPDEGRSELSHYPVSDRIEFVPLPWYGGVAADPFGLARALATSLRRLWRVLDDVEAVWVMGPHPTGFIFVALASMRRRRVVLGVRQDFPTYTRSRHPGRRGMHLLADAFEAGWRLLARRLPTVVVGPDLARNYRRARHLLPINVSLVRASDVPDAPPSRDYDGELLALSVGRLEEEKNPLMLADVLERLRATGSRWRIVVCGEGPLEEELRERLAELGLSDRADLRGYVPVNGGLLDLYRESHALLHVSWTEGVPQILFEAFAAGLPMVATAVGGVADTVGDDALVIPAGDPAAAATALNRLADDPALRERLAKAGIERARTSTMEGQCARLAAFIREG